MTTPDFPSWTGAFAAQVRQLRTTTGATLHHFELLFGSWIPSFRLAQQDQGDHSRDRCWNLRLVFWTFLWQVAQPGSPCREAIRQAQSACQLARRRVPPNETSPYCQARSKLPTQRLEQIHNSLAREAEEGGGAKDLWQGLRVRVVDATCVTAPDTPLNQEKFPQQKCQKPGCGFPILRLTALFSLATGMLLSWACGSWGQSEIALFQQLWEQLRPGDLLLGDRAFGTWAVLAQCRQRSLQAVVRVRGCRRSDFRYGKRLAQDERLVRWRKPAQRAASVLPELWSLLPEELELRLVRSRLAMPGFRTRQVILVTTLLDRQKYSAYDLGALYLRRWEMELSLRHLKTTLQMEHLSCKTPQTLERELRMHLLMHNLVRRLMLESSRRAGVPINRISFAGGLAVARRYGQALLQAPTRRQRAELMDQLFAVLAADLVPQRPGRREPRAVKRRPKPYPRLMCHRSKFKEIPHQNRYWKNSPCRKKPRR